MDFGQRHGVFKLDNIIWIGSSGVMVMIKINDPRPRSIGVYGIALHGKRRVSMSNGYHFHLRFESMANGIPQLMRVLENMKGWIDS